MQNKENKDIYITKSPSEKINYPSKIHCLKKEIGKEIGVKACIMNESLIIKPLSFSKISIGRAWGIEYEGALYHLTFWGNAGF